MYKFVVYKTINLINNRYYIGVHRTKDVNDKYLGSGVLLKVAIKKYGKKNFVKEILSIFDSYEEAFNKEREIVTLELIEKGECYNLHCGGDGNWDSINYGKLKHLHPSSNWDTADKDVKRRMIEGGRKGWAHAKQIRLQMIKEGLLKNDSFKGKRHSEEFKQKLSVVMKEKQKGEKNSQYGTCWIHCNLQSKKIKKEELDSFIENGWKKGRRI
jgi:hypothetical protein